MKLEIWIGLWLIFASSIIYWDMQRWEDSSPVSECHNVEIKQINDKYLCTQCKKYCKIKKEGR
jgi:hypothetical protein